jgi:hypothetical protein
MKAFLLFLSFCGLIVLGAQKVEWARASGGLSNDYPIYMADCGGQFIVLTNYNDSFYSLGKWYQVLPHGSLYLNFYSKNGVILKHQKVKNDSLTFTSFQAFKNGKFYATSSSFGYVGDYKVVDSVLSRNHVSYIISIDTFGNVKPEFVIQASNNGTTNRPRFSIGSLAFRGSNTYVALQLFTPNTNYKIAGQSFFVSDSAKIVMLKLRNFDVLDKSSILTSNLNFNAICIDKNNVSIPMGIATQNGYLNINGDSYYISNKSSLVIFDTNLNLFNVLSYGGYDPEPNYQTTLVSSAENSFAALTYSYLIGRQDSTFINNQWIHLKPESNVILTYISNFRIKHEKLLTSIDKNYHLQYLGVNSKNGFIYISGQILSDAFVYPDSFVFKRDYNSGAQFFLSKLDTFGNILWYYVLGGANSNSFAVKTIIEPDGVVVCGTFDSTLNLGGQLLNSGGKLDAIIFKVSDNSIYRGDIKPGPYCAGDSIFIPYTANGVYADTNSFFAELSDANGNFYGSHRTLGYLNSKVSGTIRCALPLFDVATSKNYRIRIRSNSPFVQSFMRYDSFKLLIYSKDKALPGPDTILCPGAKLKVYCKGGSVWNWSPGLSLNDSTARETIFTASKSTLLRIAIADSSGCGLPDTAFQNITVLQDPIIYNKDTMVCAFNSVVFKPLVNYNGQGKVKYEWLSPQGGVKQDSVFLNLIKDSTLKVFASGTCTIKKDTQYVQVRVFKKPAYTVKIDSMCAHVSHKLNFEDVIGKEPYFFAINGNAAMQSGNIITAASPAWYYVRVTDGCGQKVSDSIKLGLIPKIEYTLMPASSCVPFNGKLIIPTMPEDSLKIELDSKIVQEKKIDDTIFIKGEEAGTYFINIQKSNSVCINKSSVAIQIHPLPIAQLSSSKTAYSYKDKQTILLNNSLGAQFYTWVMPGRTVNKTNKDTVVLNFNNRDTLKTLLIAKNQWGCVDTARLTTIVYPPISVYFPNVISANGDGLNDGFAPVSKGIRYYEIFIFNRWGEMVYNGLNTPWVPNHKIMPGMYVYKCIYQGYTDVADEKSGTLIVIK